MYIFYYLKRFVVLLLLFCIKTYQLCISPFFLPTCRFYPTCSHYAQLALLKHNLVKAIYLIAKRICHCHPYSKGGFDMP